MLSTSQGPVGRLTIFNKLVDVETKRANRNDFNFTANVLAGNNPAQPWEKPTARNFTTRRGSIRTGKGGLLGAAAVLASGGSAAHSLSRPQREAGPTDSASNSLRKGQSPQVTQ